MTWFDCLPSSVKSPKEITPQAGRGRHHQLLWSIDTIYIVPIIFLATVWYHCRIYTSLRNHALTCNRSYHVQVTPYPQSFMWCINFPCLAWLWSCLLCRYSPDFLTSLKNIIAPPKCKIKTIAKKITAEHSSLEGLSAQDAKCWFVKLWSSLELFGMEFLSCTNTDTKDKGLIGISKDRVCAHITDMVSQPLLQVRQHLLFIGSYRLLSIAWFPNNNKNCLSTEVTACTVKFIVHYVSLSVVRYYFSITRRRRTFLGMLTLSFNGNM